MNFQFIKSNFIAFKIFLNLNILENGKIKYIAYKQVSLLNIRHVCLLVVHLPQLRINSNNISPLQFFSHRYIYVYLTSDLLLKGTA